LFLVQVLDLSRAPAMSQRLDASFDAVALPGTLTSQAARATGTVKAPSPQAVLELALRSLRPGGLLVGHFEPSVSVFGIRRAVMHPGLWYPWLQQLPWGTARRSARWLQGAGFESVETYYVEPRISAPSALISVEPQAANRHFVRSARRNRPLYSLAGYWLRMAIARLGLGGLLQAQVYFLARRPC
jgi:hypothetical protein